MPSPTQPRDDAQTGDLPANSKTHSGRPSGSSSGAMFSQGPGGRADGHERIGPYRIIRQLGQGGMGMVFLAARDDDHVRSHVAIKLVKRGMDTDEIVRRFELERRLLGALNHPNIARVMDGGVTDDGRPYFVVEYIDGKPIDEYCDNNRLSIGERLILFRTVCLAVHTAHQNLIVHRDLKPSNILVTADGVPKLLDFGIAKLLNPQLSPVANDPTATELRLMTPQYASPEQVRGDPITTSSDVYTLGVLLYELVTGHRPYHVKSRVRTEIERIICEEEPDRPSTAVSRIEEMTATSSEADAKPTTKTLTPETVSRTREGRPERLRRRLAGDVDNIVLKAMRKEPRRRYASAEQFAEDIQHHLDGMPVLAHGDSAQYRLAKFVRRHRAAALTAAVVILSLVGGLVGTTAALRVAVEHRHRAEDAERSERRQHQLATEQRDRADAIADYLRTVGRFFVLELAESGSPLEPKPRAELLRESLRALDALAASPVKDPAMRRDLAAMYEHIGDLQGSPRGGNVGDTAGALQSLHAALDLRTELAAETPNDPAVLRELATARMRMADLLAKSRDTAAALDMYRAALELLQRLVADLNDPSSRRPLAIVLMSAGDQLLAQKDFDGARKHYQRSMEFRRMLVDRPDADPEDWLSLSTGLVHMGEIDSAMSSNLLRKGETDAALRRFDDAMKAYTEAMGIRQRLFEQHPDGPRYRRFLALAHDAAGDAIVQAVFGKLIAQDRIEQAILHRQRAVRELQQLVENDPYDIRAHKDLAWLQQRLGDALYLGHQPDAALRLLREAIGQLETVVRVDPADADDKHRLALCHRQLGSALAENNHQDEGRDHLQKSIDMFKALVEASPTNRKVQQELQEAWDELAQIAPPAPAPASPAAGG